MKKPICSWPAIVMIAAVLPIAHGQSLPSTAADAAWTHLQAQVQTPSAPGKNPKTKTSDEVRIGSREHANQLKAAAQAARDFYHAFPADARVPGAKKIEVVSTLAGVLPDELDGGKNALQLARSYRADLRLPAQDRFDVALMMERTALVGHSTQQVFEATPLQLEKIADALAIEFPTIPEKRAALYATIARTADMQTEMRLAGKILQASPSAEVRAEAQAISKRYGLLGKKLSLPLVASNGQAVDLAAPPKGPTLLYIWPAGTTSFGPIGKLKKHDVKGLRVVYYSPNASVAETKGITATLPIPGTVCTDAVGVTSRVVDQLGVIQMPFAFLFDSSGALKGYGPAREIESLINMAAQ